MKTYSIFFALMAVIVFGSCSKSLTYFTDDLYNDNRWSEQELKQIQFYLSEDIRLERVYSNGGSNIENGQIKIRDQKKVDEVIIKKGTPGVLVFSPNSNRFALSFDEDSDKYLMFGPNEKARGRYVLLAKNWKKRGGIIAYGKNEYRTTSESAYAALMVDVSKARKVSKRSDTASGRRVGG
ncbi:MAG: hypothetical protein HKO66_15745 [Saprospiraceae bacterium]|nr:hypothetical protein [Saprospiraceae bacterium]NNL93695.1 hypothetical protein [Saprospiraceae bacterium]